ncbi:unnamed protein product [Penicillium roqueforti FM164]|uniref:Genomic scaffold, ProqFM164S01 n=1 Tax=Penicillium roqueforti (strain FM164) TaxID=1365484 RepID=W6QAY9_PENRF|nr:unnamed protein product [Penicillium roqueforti FM164]
MRAGQSPLAALIYQHPTWNFPRAIGVNPFTLLHGLAIPTETHRPRHSSTTSPHLGSLSKPLAWIHQDQPWSVLVTLLHDIASPTEGSTPFFPPVTLAGCKILPRVRCQVSAGGIERFHLSGPRGNSAGWARRNCETLCFTLYTSVVP